MKKNVFKELCKVDNINELYEYAVHELNVKLYNDKLIEELKKKKVIIFGAGRIGKGVLSALIKLGVNVEFFCDNNKDKWGKSIDGKVILPLQAIKNNVKENVVILIAMFLNSSAAKQVEEMEFEYLYINSDGSIGTNSSPCFYKNKDKIIQVNDMLIDETSRKVLLNVLKSKMFQSNIFQLGGSIFLHSVTTGSQYFDTQYFSYKENETFVDCGAFDGDSIVEFYKLAYEHNIKKTFVHAFEADKDNYRKLQSTLREYKFTSAKAYKLGVGYDSANTDEIYNCRKNGSESTDIEICKLDDVLIDTQVSFIKMDIEGYELDALKGAAKLIKANKPKLAICVYHNDEDLYEIPLYIKSIVPEYKIFLRHHSYNSICETVCYAY